YDLWVDDLTANISPSYRNTFVTGTLGGPGSALATDGHQYRWYIRAIDAAGRPGAWSAATDYTYSLHGAMPANPISPTEDLAVPANPVAPAGDLVAEVPQFSWSPVTGADHYDLWIDDVTANVSP